VRIFRVRWGYH